MFFKKVMLVAVLFPLTSFTAELKDCEYFSTKVLKISGGDGASCKENKLCFAEILCTKVTKKNKEVDVTRTIVCGLDSSGNCPASVETCRADKTSASFEREAIVGVAGKQDWGAVAAEAAVPILQYYYGQKMEQNIRDFNLRSIDDKKKVDESEAVR